MKNTLSQYLSKYIDMTDEERQIIDANSEVKAFKKNTILLREGQLSKECYLVLQGCVRSYYLLEGEESTTEFFLERELVTPISYIRNTPSEYYLACVEDCVLSIGTADKTQKLLELHPRFASTIGVISNELLATSQKMLDDFRNLSPEKRYLKLIETRPELVKRVPQYHLASYLGIKPQSLSRIRRRLGENTSR